MLLLRLLAVLACVDFATAAAAATTPAATATQPQRPTTHRTLHHHSTTVGVSRWGPSRNLSCIRHNFCPPQLNHLCCGDGVRLNDAGVMCVVCSACCGMFCVGCGCAFELGKRVFFSDHAMHALVGDAERAGRPRVLVCGRRCFRQRERH